MIIYAVLPTQEQEKRDGKGGEACLDWEEFGNLGQAGKNRANKVPKVLKIDNVGEGQP